MKKVNRKNRKKNRKLIKATRHKLPIDTCGKEKIVIKFLEFEKIDIEIYEGSLVDIKVYLKGKNGHTYLFENSLPISLLHYTTSSQRFYMENRAQQTFTNYDNNYSEFKLRLSDVLRYFSNAGKNFIPDNQNLTFPINKLGKKENKDSPIVYELHQSSSLQNVLDLRTYTDFLGLFNDSPNGIAQFEGNAEFFINPYTIRGTHIYLFKKIKPYVSYARLDGDDKFLNLKAVNDSTRELNDRISSLEKSFLDLGFKLDILNFKFGKGYPFEVNFYGALSYNLSELSLDSINTSKYNTLGAGLGGKIDFKRFNNFKFYYSFEVNRYNHDSYNNINGISDTDIFFAFKHEAEVSYYPTISKNNSIFTRFRFVSEYGKDQDYSFLQFQFGYKFTLGLQNIKSKG